MPGRSGISARSAARAAARAKLSECGAVSMIARSAPCARAAPSASSKRVAGTGATTGLGDLTGEPQAAYGFRAGPQEVKLSIEWPLLGGADWTGVPSKETQWLVSADQLFQTNSGSGLSCDEWLGQQVVLFDGKGISLKEMIRTVVNFEGAQSINVGRLASVEGEEASGAAKNPAPHILNAVTVFGIRYAHLIVIECALYLYEKLLDESSIRRPSGDICDIGPISDAVYGDALFRSMSFLISSFTKSMGMTDARPEFSSKMIRTRFVCRLIATSWYGM